MADAGTRGSVKCELELKSESESVAQQQHHEEMEEGEISDAPSDPGEVVVESTSASKRFSLVGDESLALAKEELAELYGSLGIEQDNERHYRFNTIHMRRTDSMTTRHVLDYFSGFHPLAVHWLDQGVCNVEWDDEIVTARALFYLSEEMPRDDVMPSGLWRKGVSYDIIMRYATKHDTVPRSQHKGGKRVKVREREGAEDPWGRLALSWGRGEGTEAIEPATPTSDLRTALNSQLDSRLTEVYLTRAARLRRDKPPSPPVFLQSSESSGDSEESCEEFVGRRKLPKMHADREQEKILMSRVQAANKTLDLRTRLNRHQHQQQQQQPSASEASHSDSDDSDDEPGQMLQIQIDNEYCHRTHVN